MRNSALAFGAAVLLSVGCIPTRAAAQTGEPAGVANGSDGAISRRVHIDFGARAGAGSGTPSLPWLGRMFAPAKPGAPAKPAVPERLDIPASTPPIDCGMPTVKGDPNIDPKIVTPPPSADKTTYFLRGMPAPWCAGA